MKRVTPINLSFIKRIIWLFKMCPTCNKKLYKYDWGEWLCSDCNLIWETQSLNFKENNE